MFKLSQLIADSPIRILVVEDEEPHRLLLREVFDDSHYQLTEASNGEQALALLLRHKFDVVLLDNNMPGLEGVEVCRRIRAQEALALLPVIMVTGLNSTHDLTRALKFGADDFVGKPYSPLELEARVRSAVARKRITDQLDNAEAILFALAQMVEARDSWTGDHCARLAWVGMVFGRKLGLCGIELDDMRRGGVLHDIGKLAIPDEILLKTGPLDAGEWDVMRNHPVIGAELCSGLASMQRVSLIIRHHHERWDGKGYPDGLQGEEIPMMARVFQLVDVFDALSSERPYKKALPMEMVIQIMEKDAQNGISDPKLSQVFLEILRTDQKSLQLPEVSVAEGRSPVYQRLLDLGVLQGARFSPT